MKTRYADQDWHAQNLKRVAEHVASERMPRVGDLFTIPGELTTREITEVFSVWGEVRFRAHSPLQVRTFERIARNQWRAFQDYTAPVFSLSA